MLLAVWLLLLNLILALALVFLCQLSERYELGVHHVCAVVLGGKRALERDYGHSAGR